MSRDQWKLPLLSSGLYESSSDNVSTDYNGLGSLFSNKILYIYRLHTWSVSLSFSTGATFSSTTERLEHWTERAETSFWHARCIFFSDILLLLQRWCFLLLTSEPVVSSVIDMFSNLLYFHVHIKGFRNLLEISAFPESYCYTSVIVLNSSHWTQQAWTQDLGSYYGLLWDPKADTQHQSGKGKGCKMGSSPRLQ